MSKSRRLGSLLLLSNMALSMGLAQQQPIYVPPPAHYPAMPESMYRGQPAINTLENRTDRIREEIVLAKKSRTGLLASRDAIMQELTDLNAERANLIEKNQLITKWRANSLVVLSERSAVGITTTEPGEFTLSTIAEYPDSAYVSQICQKLNIPRISGNDRLAEKLLERHREGQRISSSESQLLGRYWKVHKYVPISKEVEPMFVTFKDLEGGARRLGLLLDVQESSFQMHGVGSESETIHRSRIEAGSARKGNAQRLDIESEADFLDMAILRIAQKLESDANVPGYQALAIQVQADDLEEALKLSRTVDNSWRDQMFDYFARATGEDFRPDQRKEPTRILRRIAQSLHDEIGSRLNRLNVPVVEREELGLVVAERELSKTGHFDQRTYVPLTSASHLLIAEVGKPVEGGQYRLSIRLTDANTGSTVFEDNADMGKPTLQIADQYYVHRGELGLVTRKTPSDKPSKSYNTKAQKQLKLEPLASSHAPTRLGLVERHNAETLVFRDLFSVDVQLLDLKQFDLKPVTEVKAIPGNEKIRWITWQVMQSTLPFAGQVMRVESERAYLNIGANHGIKSGDVFQVVRLGKEEDGIERQVLPFEVRVDNVGTRQSTGFVGNAGMDQLWPALQIMSGDLVVRRGAQNVVMEVRPAQFNQGRLAAQVARKLKLMNNAAQFNRLGSTMNRVAETLADNLNSALQSQGVVTAAVNSQRATHVLTGSIVPTETTSNCDTFEIFIEIRLANNNQIVKSIGPVIVSEEDVATWTP